MPVNSTPRPRPPRLLIVGMYYAPEETGIGPYTSDLAEHMAACGWSVTVAAGMPHYPQWRVSSEYRRRVRASEHRCGVNLRRFRQFTPGQQTVTGRALYEGTFFLQTAWAGRALGGADCVVGIVPTLGGGAAAALLARRMKVPLGIVFQDLMGQAAVQSGLPGGGRAAIPVRHIEGWVARRADGVAIIADAFRPYVEAAGVEPQRITHLRNWTHVDAPTGQAAVVRERMGWKANQQVVLHAGNMGYKQDLGNVISAAQLAHQRSLPVLFVLMGDGSDRRRLEQLASGMQNVEILDSQPSGLFMDVLAAADVLLLNERPTVCDMSLPSKITSYFVAGKPVVAAVAAAGATAKELANSGGALVTDAGDPAGLLDAIRSVAADSHLAEGLIRNATDYANANLGRAAQLDRCEQFVTSLLRSREPLSSPDRAGP